MSGLEMPEIPRQDSSVGLLIDENSARSDKSLVVAYPRIRDFLRQFRLQLLSLLAGRFSNFISNKEEPKVAIYQSRRVAALHSLLHLAPLSGAFTLIILHWTKHWIGYTSSDSHFLQFIAKLHELVMQASITEVLLFTIRMRLIMALCLWSLDYFSVITSSAFRGWRKAIFIIGLPALIALTALVGPSSAVLMIPRSGSPLVVDTGKVFIDGSDETLYPPLVGKSNGFNLDIPSFSVTAAGQRISEAKSSYDVFGVETSTAYSVNFIDQTGNFQRHLQASVREPNYRSTDIGNYTQMANTTIPTSLSADRILYQAWNATESKNSLDSNRTLTIDSYHPFTSAACWEPLENNYNTVLRYILKDGASSGDLQKLGEYAERVSHLEHVANSTSNFVEEVLYPAVWIPSPEKESNMIIGILFHMFRFRTQGSVQSPKSLTQTLKANDSSDEISCVVCTLSAYWNFGEVQWIETAGTTLIQTASLSMLAQQKARPISFNLSDMGVLDSTDYTSVMFQGPLALRLAGSFAVALAEIPQTKNLSGVSTNLTEFRNAYNSGNFTTLEYTNTLYGYGYGVRTTSSYLSLTVMYVYSIITILYLGYSFFTGLTSTAWSSAVELVALALQSSKPSVLGDSAVGIDSVKTFSQSVGIRVNTNRELELIFGSDGDSSIRALRQVEYDQAY